jgi:spermidine synthase
MEAGHSKHSGPLELRLENGKKVLNTSKVNFSYGSLEQVFRLSMAKVAPPPQALKDGQVLILGFGGGSIVHILREKYKFKGAITGVDFDPELVSFASRHFPESFESVNLVIADAEVFMDNTSQEYDLVFVDLFINDQTLPKALQTHFLQQLKDVTSPGGMIYHNVMIRNTQKLKLFVETYRKIFKQVEVLQLLGANQVVVALNG